MRRDVDITCSYVYEALFECITACSILLPRSVRVDVSAAVSRCLASLTLRDVDDFTVIPLNERHLHLLTKVTF